MHAVKYLVVNSSGERVTGLGGTNPAGPYDTQTAAETVIANRWSTLTSGQKTEDERWGIRTFTVPLDTQPV
jgi:hypothetical protein